MMKFQIASQASAHSKTNPSWLLLLIIYLTACLIQANVFLNWDVSLLMHATSRMLSGGQYGIDFFDTDPPMILFIYTFPVLLAKLFSISYAVSSALFTFFVSLFSLFFCNKLLQLIEQQSGVIYKRAFLLPLIAAIMVFPPAMNFAQREHFMLLLVMPYLLATVVRIEKQKLDWWLALMAGLLAGLGFAIKPHFYITFALVELYYLSQRKGLPFQEKLRLESLLIAGVAAAYLLVILVFYQTYLKIILPTILQYYYAGLEALMSPLLVWTEDNFLFSLTTIVFYFILLRGAKNKTLETVLLCSVLGFDLAYLLQKTYWYYHILPAFSVACLLWAQSWYRYFLANSDLFDKKGNGRFLVRGLQGLLIAAVLFLPLRYIYEANEVSVLSKKDGPFSQIIEHLQIFPAGSSVYFFSGCLLPYPMVDYLNFKEEQLAQTYWFLPGIIFQENQAKGSHQPVAAIAETMVLNKIVNDFVARKADLVVVDKRINCNGYPFDFLEYFSQDARFKAAFKNYRYVDGYETVAIYRRG